MNAVILNNIKSNYKILVFDLFALLAIYLIPVFSHSLSLPLYYIEPMRIAILFSVIFAGRKNSIIIALTLPMFSYAISTHPVLFKSMLISSELILNVLIFYSLKKLSINSAISFGAAVLGSKIYYYLVKYLLLQFAFLNGSLISTPIYFQIIMLLIFTASIFTIEKLSQNTDT